HPDQQNWLSDSCPGGWTKCGTMAKGVQLNLESDKNTWLYDILNKPSNGLYTKSRSEIVGQQLYAGWWTSNQYKEMFAIMCYCIYWGIDWPNETAAIIQDPKHDSAFNFFNKYASQKVPGLAQHALCALKDVLDASDSIRFPSQTYGQVSQTNVARYNNIYSKYISYGAQLQDVSAATGNEYDCLNAKGTNDVGWHLLPGNYERYLHQIDANITSAGYWNVDAAHPDAMYGRFARGFDVANGKNDLYFDVENDFLGNVALRGAYPVTIEITYYDSGTGSWQLCYNAVGVGNLNKTCSPVTCTDTKTWKKAVFVLSDARFANKGERNSDFYIKNVGSSNVIFSTVELSKPPQSSTAFITTPVSSFDTVCQNSDIAPKNFVLNAASLDGSKVEVGPLNGFLFSTKANGTFSNSLDFTNYGSALNYTIYVKINTKDTGDFTDKIPVKGGGLPTAHVKVYGTVLNSSPALNADVTTISCYNRKDGAIDLNLKGGQGPFTYNWTNDAVKSWGASTEDIDSLNDANYTVTVGSVFGCSISKTFSISQPDILVTSVSQDSAIKCKGGFTTVNISAAGGTTPYSGVGKFTVPAGFQTYTVTDARGCVDPQGYKVEAGTLTAPTKPDGINGPTTVSAQQSNIVFNVQNQGGVSYVWTVPSDATIASGQHTSSITVKWGSAVGPVTVQTSNSCGSSPVCSKTIHVAKNFDAIAATLPGMDNKNSILLMPNPVKDIATLQFSAKTSCAYTIEITDLSGKSLISMKGTTTSGTNTQKINVSQFTPGTYFIILTNNEGERETVKMIKE
ncbi:MAG TPA: T9SS type A sorting domain-containing protein, partial [Parafilimonas sp.]